MVNKQKRKGTDWERLLEALINKYIKKAEAKRIPGSGAIGTILEMPSLTSDLKIKLNGFTRLFKVEAKVGYGGAKQLTMKKEWFDKIKEEADASLSYPAVAMKFSGARKDSGIQYVIAFDFDTFADIMNHVSDLSDELEQVYLELQRIKEKDE